MSSNDKKQFRWIRKHRHKGEFLFTFDGIKVYNLFRDYPHELTIDEKQMFDKENPYWAEFFKSRKHK